MDEKDNPLFERLVVAVEGLLTINQEMAETQPAGDPVFGPPICPNCRSFNPMIELSQQFGGQGAFAEFGMQVECLRCSKTFYAAPDGWSVFKTQDEFQELLEQRIALIKELKLGDS